MFTACHPRFYSFSVSPKNVTDTEAITIDWDAKGKVTMGIHDIPNAPQNGTPLNPVQIVIKQSEKSDTFRLGPTDSIVEKLPSQGHLTIRMIGFDTSERLRYIRFVARRFFKDSIKDREVGIFSGAIHGQIGFNRKIRGDSLISEGPDTSDRWLDTDQIATVSDSSGHDVEVSHAETTATIPGSGATSRAFAGLPVKGWWSIRRLLTTEEKADRTSIPKSLNIYVTIKRR